MVSIHAPARGATQINLWCVIDDLFQSTHPHGVRPIVAVGISARSEFQSTHPHGVRLRTGVSVRKILSFNPRTRTGCDVNKIRKSILIIVSIHAPARGATNNTVGRSPSRPFQSTHPHGVRQIVFVQLTHNYGFNPRTRTGCDPLMIVLNYFLSCFNPRTRTGCDRLTTPNVSSKQSFNPRTRTGCDNGEKVTIEFVPCFNPRTRTGCDCFS